MINVFSGNKIITLIRHVAVAQKPLSTSKIIELINLVKYERNCILFMKNYSHFALRAMTVISLHLLSTIKWSNLPYVVTFSPVNRQRDPRIETHLVSHVIPQKIVLLSEKKENLFCFALSVFPRKERLSSERQHKATRNKY